MQIHSLAWAKTKEKGIMSYRCGDMLVYRLLDVVIKFFKVYWSLRSAR